MPATADPELGLRSEDIPQHRDLGNAVRMVRYVAGRSGPPDLEPRHLGYCKHAARVLGWLDGANQLTETGSEIALARFEPDSGEALRYAVDAMGRARVFRAWMRWQGVDTLAGLDPRRAREFLEARAPSLSEQTRNHRAGALRRWIEAAVPRQVELELRVDPLLSVDPEVCPNNEGPRRTGGVVRSDLAEAKEILVVAGYASLVEVARAVFTLPNDRETRFRVLFGGEAIVTEDANRSGRPFELAKEAKEHWLERGVSLDNASWWLEALERMESPCFDARIGAHDGRVVHGKAVLTDTHVTMGSSNFTRGGFERNHELNVRLGTGCDRHEPGIRALAESLWDAGAPYKADLLALMRSLLRAVSWREALARACTEVLSGTWAKRALPTTDLARASTPLWPHQESALASVLWLFENVGLILVADAAGSGKTRLGAWAFRVVFERLSQEQGAVRNAVVICPPAVATSWKLTLGEAGITPQVYTDAALSHSKSEDGKALERALLGADLVLVDEAHRFLISASKRTSKLLAAGPAHVLAFTATPINRGATDFLGLMELLGADHFEDDAIDAVSRLARRERGSLEDVHEEIQTVRDALGACMLRRTRAQLQDEVSRHPEAYRVVGRDGGYPRLTPGWYELPCSDHDERRLSEIRQLTGEIRGIHRMDDELRLSKRQERLGWTPERYVRAVLGASAALARYVLLSMLRSSRPAAYGHILGVPASAKAFGLTRVAHSSGGNSVAKIRKKAGRPPVSALPIAIEKMPDVPAWLWDPQAHEEAADAEEKVYRRIAELVRELSEAREEAKAARLIALSRDGKVLGFDHHVLTLVDMKQRLDDAGVEASLVTGAAGKSARRGVLASFGRGARGGPRVALLSDALNEGVNLQGAAAIVHLDWPTVLRAAEQRTGRIDRMDSEHATVRVFWPHERGVLALDRSERRLFERNALVRKTVGANLELPDELLEDDESEVRGVDALESLRDRATSGMNLDQLTDAFAPVRALMGPGGLVPEALIAELEGVRADVVACVSLVPSESPWAFFCVGHRQRRAPQWLVFDGVDTPPVVGLRASAACLRARLEHDPGEAEPGESSRLWLTHFVARLDRHADALVPPRFRRVLELLRGILPEYLKSARRSRDQKRIETIDALRKRCAAERADVDLSRVGQVLWRLLAPYRERHLNERPTRRVLMRTSALRSLLLERELSTGELEELLTSARPVPPPSMRCVAAIIGVATGSRERPGTP